jgi:hypothetical protein
MTAQIGLALLWLIFTLELFTMTHIMAHNKTAIAVWACLRAVPLLMVSVGLL